jgi:hypothetical protein
MTLSDQGRARITDPVEWVQGLIAALVVGATCYVAVVGAEIKPELMLLSSTVVGFYFGKTIRSNAVVRKTE